MTQTGRAFEERVGGTERRSRWRRCILAGVVLVACAPTRRVDTGGEHRDVEVAQAESVTARPSSEHAAPEFEKLERSGAPVRHLELIQDSPLKMNGSEQNLLEQNGFVLARRIYPTFATGYLDIYKHDLPVYVSADSILDSLHRSYDLILMSMESGIVIPEFTTLLDHMRAALASGKADAFGPETKRDLDLYLGIPRSLLTDEVASPVAGASRQSIRQFVAKAKAASGMGGVTLFGRSRNLDFSQFKPRGHYTRTEQLSRYFRAMMWFGRIDVRVTAVDERTHRSERDERATRAALALRTLLDEQDYARWRRIDQIVETFVGGRDSASFDDLDRLLQDLGAQSPKDALEVPAARWVAAMKRNAFGAQRIASHERHNDKGSGTVPLSRSFSPFGQRFVPGSEVFTKVTYDSIPAKRMMPKPLDVAYAALGNAQAKLLLADELDAYGYEKSLDQARATIDAFDANDWESSLYGLWLSSLRSLSPGATSPDGLPDVARTEAWGLRLLNTQLASWAQLRRDTILYAKQSYTASILCEYPDAYVDPYPEFYASLLRYAESGQRVANLVLDAATDRSAHSHLAKRVLAYFDNLKLVVRKLKEMAEYQRRGEPFTEDQLAFINDAVVVKSVGGGCGGPNTVLRGWYARLFYDREKALEWDPTIADVHTQPTDENGGLVGKVLHVGTGGARRMVVTVETCDGPSAYVGLASTYYEKTTTGFQRLDEHEWQRMVEREKSPAWLAPIIAQ